jgi:Amt family ammonium transporter
VTVRSNAPIFPNRTRRELELQIFKRYRVFQGSILDPTTTKELYLPDSASPGSAFWGRIMVSSKQVPVCGALTAAMAFMAAPAMGADAVKVSAGDTAWVLTSSALVLLMTAPGPALFYAGMVRRKNVLATLMHSFILAALYLCAMGAMGLQPHFHPGTP